MAPDQRHPARERKAHRQENLIGKLSPVRGLQRVELIGMNQSPRSENIDLVRPDRADVVERKGQIKNEKGRATDGPRV